MAEDGALAAVEAALGHEFTDKSLLRAALVHPSAAAGKGGIAFERLEFLGDRVLGLALAALLLCAFPDEEPGDLTRRHAALAGGEAVAGAGRSIGLHRHMRLQGGLGRDRGGLPDSMIEDCCEAVIGAVYLDAGHDAAAAVVERFWAPSMPGAAPRDAKSALQEWAQGRGLPLPTYRVLAREGPDHGPAFTVQAAVEGGPTATASGRSRRAAERAAARALLDGLDDGRR